MDQQRELEKETAMQARKELFQELKSKKTKIARINYQMTTVQMVCAISHTLCSYMLCILWRAHNIYDICTAHYS